MESSAGTLVWWWQRARRHPLGGAVASFVAVALLAGPVAAQEGPPTSEPSTTDSTLAPSSDELPGEYPGPCPEGTGLNDGAGAIVHTVGDGGGGLDCINRRAGDDIPGPCPATNPGPDNGGHIYTDDGICHNRSGVLPGPCDPATSPPEANGHIVVDGVGCTDYQSGSGPCPEGTNGSSGGSYYLVDLADRTCTAVLAAVVPSEPGTEVAEQLPRTGLGGMHLRQTLGLAIAALLLGVSALGWSNRRWATWAPKR